MFIKHCQFWLLISKGSVVRRLTPSFKQVDIYVLGESSPEVAFIHQQQIHFAFILGACDVDFVSGRGSTVDPITKEVMKDPASPNFQMSFNLFVSYLIFRHFAAR
jgi:hypothetical protein